MRAISILSRAVSFGTLLAVALAAPAPSRVKAQTAYPTRYVLRPLTLDRAMLRFDADAIYRHRAGPPDETFGLDAGLGIGITRDFELGATFLPLQLAPDVDYLQPSFYVQGRFVRGTAEVAVRGSVMFPTNDAEHALFEVGLPILIHVGRVVRFDLGAFLQLETTDPLGWWVRFPLGLTINATPRFFLGPYAGFRVRLDARGQEIPVGFLAGYAIGGGTVHPVGDIGGQFQFDDVTSTAGNWSLALVTRWFIYL